MRFLFLEPFFGGSHRDFARGLAEHSEHEFEFLTLPARFWKWRMRGAALYFLNKVKDLSGYDGIFASSLMSLADFKALAGPACPPALLYFHENQLTYPLAPGETPDYHFGFTDITSALAADMVVMSSKTHFDAFFSELPVFISRMPEYRPRWAVERIRKKASVLTPGCRFPVDLRPAPRDPAKPPLIIWNHRWEYDKAPGAFFAALYRVKERGIPFRLALLGENFSTVPQAFPEARERLKDEIVRFGYANDRKEYLSWLSRGWVAVSTALQENFGISVVEAMRYGCLPLLPDRLSYPEILPRRFHPDFLYQGPDDLVEKLCGMLSAGKALERARQDVSASMAMHAWPMRVPFYDDVLSRLARMGKPT
ncbi:MAG: DUF3524 domain-containing protein [Thermodesulfobacteriota bacterium]